MMFKKIKPIFLLVFFLLYGILIGKYEIFPYNLLKIIQDRFQKHSLEKEFIIKDYKIENIESYIDVNVSNIDSIRSRLRLNVFGSKELSKKFPDTVYRIKDRSYKDLKNLNFIEQFELRQNYNITSIGYIFHPNSSNNRLLIYHQGHGGDFILGKNTIQYFLEKGFTIVSFSMPLEGKNNQPVISLNKLGEIYMDDHDRFKFLENPISYFILPVISMINYSENFNFQDITMIGISGGGWTTTICAALDSRINYSFPIAGTYPMFIRFKTPQKNYGDFEQTYSHLYKEINYLDMYILGAVGKNRKQVQIINKYDPCCFGGEDYKYYANFISDQVKTYSGGEFAVLSDSTHVQHKISSFAHDKIYDYITTH